MSTAELSLDISRIVSRAIGGEAIDIDCEGSALAEKYPDLGIPPDLIAKAIDRAAGMVEAMRSPSPAPPGEPPANIANSSGVVPLNGHAPSVDLLPTLEEELASTLAAELAGGSARTARDHSPGNGSAPLAARRIGAGA